MAHPTADGLPLVREVVIFAVDVDWLTGRVTVSELAGLPGDARG